jgi:carboxypeptidase C (cathepsin A)
MRFVLPLVLSLGLSQAQEQHPPRGPAQPPPSAAIAAPPAEHTDGPGAQHATAPPAVEKLSTTQHVLNVKGVRIPYTATAGTLILKKEDGTPRASIFFVSYSRDDRPDKSKWPITYSFNGGPGSASVWLHLGALGPRRVRMGPEGEQPTPPYQMVDNEDTALAFTDLCFIDPVTTGFSRPAPGENAQQFHGYDGDIESVAAFIRLWTTRFDRWASPKFLAGESYGTTRAAGLSQYLMDHDGIYLNGITLISTVLNFETISFATGNDLPYALFLPTYTATAWYHKKLPPELQKDLSSAVEESRKFAGNDYTIALMKGDKLGAEERVKVARQLSRLTGLQQQYIEDANLRISISRFDKELLRKERRTVGRYDSRLEGIDLDSAGERPEYDPSYASVQGVFTAMFNSYVRDELKFDTEIPYEVLTDRVRPWNYDNFQNQYVNVAERLRQAMTRNPTMKVLVANGYYDLATPFFATEYTMYHLGLDPTLSNDFSLTYCDAGHMLYTKKSCLDGLHKAMGDLYQRTTGTP